MKKNIRFVLRGSNYYVNDIVGSGCEGLADLFETEIRCQQDTYFTEWLDDPKAWGAAGNIITVDAMKDGAVEIRNMLDEEQGPAFVMPKEQYRKMVLEWQELCKQKPKEIIITWDGKKITVDGRN